MCKRFIDIEKEELKELILSGKTLKQLAQHFRCSDAVITRRKRLYGLVGLTPNNKKGNSKGTVEQKRDS